MSTENDQYLIRLYTHKTPIKQIAAKMGMTEQEVEDRLNALEATAEAMAENGYMELSNLYNNLALQYQLFGQTMMQVGTAFEKPLTLVEVADLIKESRSPEKAAEVLLKNCIVLKKFKTMDPAEILKQHMGG